MNGGNSACYDRSMKYFQTGIELAKSVIGKSEGPSKMDTLRFTRDSLQVAAGLAIAGGLTIEAIGSSTEAHGIGAVVTVLGLGIEAGAQLVNVEFHRVANRHTVSPIAQ